MKKALALLLIVILALSAVSFLSACGKEKEEPPAVDPNQEPQEEPEPQIPEDDPELPGAFLVMIDNMVDARPQSGLDKADVVFEIEAEGGITRYMALFYNNAVEKVGPIRSARYYFAQLAKGLGGIYVHVGGSTDGYSSISQLKVNDIDGMKATAKQFYRTKDRKAPHNCYTTTDTLVEMAQKKGYDLTAPKLPAYALTFDGEPLESGRVTLTYSKGKAGYNVEYVWEEGLGPDGGQYRRYMKGEPAYTLEGEALVADTIFIMECDIKARNTKPLTSSVDVIGSGPAVCVVENRIIKGTWNKESAEAPLIFKDEAGNEMCRKFGRTWVQVVPSLDIVSYNEPDVPEKANTEVK